MKEEEIKELFEQFEAIANEYEGVKCWSARELAQVLGYSKWERFEGVIERAKDACINAGEMVEYHFPGVWKMIPLAKGAQREVKDYMLTRYACYLIAQNGDPRKPQISFAQNLLCRTDSPSRTGSKAFAGIRTCTSTCKTCRNREASLWCII